MDAKMDAFHHPLIVAILARAHRAPKASHPMLLFWRLPIAVHAQLAGRAELGRQGAVGEHLNRHAYTRATAKSKPRSRQPTREDSASLRSELALSTCSCGECNARGLQEGSSRRFVEVAQTHRIRQLDERLCPTAHEHTTATDENVYTLSVTNS